MDLSQINMPRVLVVVGGGTAGYVAALTLQGQIRGSEMESQTICSNSYSTVRYLGLEV